jgi:L-lactate dehydrogenase complex protein LldG
VEAGATVSTARAEILARVRAAVRAGTPAPVAPRSYRRAGTRSRAETVERFCERVADYRAEVQRTAPPRVADVVEAACRARGARRLVVAPGIPTAWRPAGLELVEDAGLAPRELDALDGVLTGCTVAIAETGTIALASGAHDGRRAISLVPDLHVCVVEHDQIVELVPEAIRLLGEHVGSRNRPITFISGPSATSDIELSRVEGVHGPRTLVVIVVAS